MKTIDLTHTIKDGMPVFPGTETPRIEEVFSHEVHGFQEHRLTLFSHIGTHIDAPAHMIKDGTTLDRMETDRFVGPGVCIDCTHRNSADPHISIDDLAAYESEISESDFVILNSGWYKNWGTDKYFKHYPALTPEAARWLTDFDLKGVGVDVISIDSAESGNYEVHSILLEQDTIAIENLTELHLLPADCFLFSCLPLKYENADGSPVRALAIY
ncbi:cyclase family protein [Desulfovibrio sp. JC010]|uniref:cyclase family protein n=1 Tax=Desulfovibrio sp. JC010 TaxID=2593641 RepID=UPI0013D887AC|nr:cyclase family protein [Desulfovibrio sp. JC010]NDV28725.1 cyclase family protein [Desulfovibrio sp. JC010]